MVEELEQAFEKQAQTDVSDLPASYILGEELDWNAEWSRVILTAELPFWLMVPDVEVTVREAGHDYVIAVADGMMEVHRGQYRDSKHSISDVGIIPGPTAEELIDLSVQSQQPHLARKNKTVLAIVTRCNSDVLAKLESGPPAVNEAYAYLAALCEAHIPLVNKLINSYRLATYDRFAHEISPYDVPIWFLASEGTNARIGILSYAEWDYKPVIRLLDDQWQIYNLLSPEVFQEATTERGDPGELELLDAINLIERGDYSGAIRRITTALEVATEFALSQELRKGHSAKSVQRQLKNMSYFKQVTRYEELSARQLPAALRAEVETTRDLRHKIVHEGLRVAFSDRGRAQRAVDTGRWTFNWFENRTERIELRERRIALRSLGRHFSLFNSELTEDGVVVHPIGHPGASA